MSDFILESIASDKLNWVVLIFATVSDEQKGDWLSYEC